MKKQEKRRWGKKRNMKNAGAYATARQEMGNNATWLQDIKASKDNLNVCSQAILQAHANFSTQSRDFFELLEKLGIRIKELEEREEVVERRERDVKDKIQQLQEREKKCVENEHKIEARDKEVLHKEAKWMETEKRMQQNADNIPNNVNLNISGSRFTVPKEKLLQHKGSLFEEMLVSDHPPLTPEGDLFVARDPAPFHHIIRFLLDGSFPTPHDEKEKEIIAQEFAYFKLKRPELIKDFGRKIAEWLPGKQFRLIYKASIDGFKAADFHELCDNKGPTLTMIRSSKGYLFGGYTDIHWDSTSNNKQSTEEGFIFTLTNPHNFPPTKYPRIKSQTAIHCNATYGPTFGNGDIVVYSNSNLYCSSYISFPKSYSDTTGKKTYTFTGENLFSTSEIEVYAVL